MVIKDLKKMKSPDNFCRRKKLKIWSCGHIFDHMQEGRPPICCMCVAHRTASVAEIRSSVGTRMTQWIVTNRLFQGQLRDRLPVAYMSRTTPNYQNLRLQWCHARAHWKAEWRCVVYSDVSHFAFLQPLMALYRLEEDQMSARNQTVFAYTHCTYIKSYGLRSDFLWQQEISLR